MRQAIADMTKEELSQAMMILVSKTVPEKAAMSTRNSRMSRTGWGGRCGHWTG